MISKFNKQEIVQLHCTATRDKQQNFPHTNPLLWRPNANKARIMKGMHSLSGEYQSEAC